MGWLLKPTGTVNYVPFTNTVYQPVYVTNTATGQVVTNTVLVPQIVDRWQTNYAPNPSLVAPVQTVSTVAGGILPPPWGTVVQGAGAVLLGLLGLFAKVKSGQLSTANQIISAVVSGVEAAGNQPTKQAIAAAANAAGVQSELHAIVLNQTDTHPGAIASPPTPAKV